MRIDCRVAACRTRSPGRQASGRYPRSHPRRARERRPNDHPVGVEAMEMDVALGKLSQARRDSPRDRLLFAKPRAGKIGEISAPRSGPTAPSSTARSPAVPMNPTWLVHCLQRRNPRLAARRDEIMALARKPDPFQLARDSILGPRRVGEETTTQRPSPRHCRSRSAAPG